MKANNKKIKVDKRIVFIIFILIICLFCILFILKIGVDYNDKHLPIYTEIKNKLHTTETIKLQLNDSIYLLTLDSNESKELNVTFQKGLNKILIFLSNSQAIVDTTLNVDTRYPGELHIELDLQTNDLGYLWEVDSSNILCYFYYKSFIGLQNGKRLKLALAKMYIF